MACSTKVRHLGRYPFIDLLEQFESKQWDVYFGASAFKWKSPERAIRRGMPYETSFIHD
jgi:hypothetical protein